MSDGEAGDDNGDDDDGGDDDDDGGDDDDDDDHDDNDDDDDGGDDDDDDHDDNDDDDGGDDDDDHDDNDDDHDDDVADALGWSSTPTCERCFLLLELNSRYATALGMCKCAATQLPPRRKTRQNLRVTSLSMSVSLHFPAAAVIACRPHMLRQQQQPSSCRNFAASTRLSR